MADVVNLRQQRKRKARAEKAQQAQANRVKHGRSSAQRQRDTEAAARDAEKLDQHRRESARSPASLASLLPGENAPKR